MRDMIDKSKLGYRKHVLEEFEFANGKILQDVEVEYTTRGTPKYDENGNVTNAIIYCHRFNENCLSIGNLHQLIGPESELEDFNYFYISITSLGYPESCSPSTTNLKTDFPKYTIKDRVDFKRKFLADAFNITKVLGIIGAGIGGYEAYTWGCEYPDEMEFLLIGNSAYKTSNYRYIISKCIESVILSSDNYMDGSYDKNITKILSSVNLLIYSQYLSRKAFQNFSQEEIDILMDTFIDDGMSRDIYDLKYRNDAVLNYDVEDKLSNIRAKTWVTTTKDDIYYSPEFDAYPLKDKIENLIITSFNAEEFTYKYDYSMFVDQFREFLEEFKK